MRYTNVNKEEYMMRESQLPILQEGDVMMPDVVNHHVNSNEKLVPEIVAVVDLGEGNDGSIFPDDLSESQLKSAINDIASPEYRRRPTRRWRCVDGRVPEGGLSNEEGLADPQIAGGYIIADTSADLMLEVMAPEDRHSDRVARKTTQAISDDIEVIVHGDDHVETNELGESLTETNKAGCKANVEQRTILERNAENADIVIPKVMAVAKIAGLAQYYTDQDGRPHEGALADRITGMINTGKQNADNDAYWDITPEQKVDTIVANGGKYEELIEEHAEVVAVADCSEGAIDEEHYMRDHVIEHADGTSTTLEAFIASIGEYKKLQFELAEKHGRSEVWAADKTLAVILQTVGTVKRLTKDGFPVAIIS